MFEELVTSLWASIHPWFTPTVFFVVLNIMIGTIAITSSFFTHKHNDRHYSHDNSNGYPHPNQIARTTSMLQRLKSINFYSYRTPEPATSFQFHTPQEYAATQTQLHFSFQEQTTVDREEEQPQVLPRTPSILQRLKSISFSHYLFSDAISTHHDSSANSDDSHAVENIHQDLSQSYEDEDDRGEDEVQEQEEQSMDEIYSRLKSGQVNRCNSDTKPSSGQMPPKLTRKMKKSASTKSAFSHFEEGDIVEKRRPETAKEEKVSMLTDVDEGVDAKADDFIKRFKQQLKLQRLDSIMRYRNMISRATATTK